MLFSIEPEKGLSGLTSLIKDLFKHRDNAINKFDEKEVRKLELQLKALHNTLMAAPSELHTRVLTSDIMYMFKDLI